MTTVDARFINDSGVVELEGTIDAPAGFFNGGTITKGFVAQLGAGETVAQAAVQVTTVDNAAIDPFWVDAGALVGVFTVSAQGTVATTWNSFTFAGRNRLQSADGEFTAIQNGDEGRDIIRCEAEMAGDKIGFYGAAAVAQQTGVAVSAAGIHAALVNLGLITA
jgi:hypothetical protein